MSKLKLSERTLCVASVSWLAAFLAAPSWHSSPTAFCATSLVILVNAAFSLRVLTKQRRVVIVLNCVQIALFGVLNYQLYSAFGPDHYRCDREPWFFDWIEFTAAHVVRAADLLDAIDEYGIPIQTISHNSLTSGLLIVSMHLSVDVFLIGLVLRWASQYWLDTQYETHLQRGRREFAWLFAALGLYVAFVIIHQLEPLDWILWPLDNVLRLLDVGDMFQVFGWRLHRVEPTIWTSAAAVLFRLAAGIWMARLVCWFRMVVCRAWGLSIDELIELLDDPDPQVRRWAANGLGESGRLAERAVPELIAALHDINRDVRTEAARALGRIGPAAADAIDSLIQVVWLGHRELRLAATTALGRMGPAARCAAYSLLSLLKVCDGETFRVATVALERIAPELAGHLPKRKRKAKKNWKRFGRRSAANLCNPRSGAS